MPVPRNHGREQDIGKPHCGHREGRAGTRPLPGPASKVPAQGGLSQGLRRHRQLLTHTGGAFLALLPQPAGLPTQEKSQPSLSALSLALQWLSPSRPLRVKPRAPTHSPLAAETTKVLDTLASHDERDRGGWLSLFPLAAGKLNHFHLHKRTPGSCTSLSCSAFFSPAKS